MNYALDVCQEKAVRTNSVNTLIVASPGSGKTTVIINRIIYLINELNVNPENIIVITFTKAAAENMKNRYIRIYKSKDTPYFGTMHSLFYKMLRKYNSEIKIIDEAEVYHLIKNVLLTYLDEISEEKIKETINNISCFKTSNHTKEDFKPSIDRNVFLHCLKEYENYKEKNMIIDFDDLQIECKKLLNSNKESLEFFREKFQYVLVDEFQDCDDLQIEILKLLNYRNSIFAVGDEDQSIYGFRGSKPKYMVEFNKIFTNSTVLYLKVNYRSPKNIVDISNKLIINNFNRNDKKINSFKNYSTKINVISCMDEDEEAETISSTLLNLAKEKIENLEESAIIYRTNRESSMLIDVLVRKNIAFNLLDKEFNIYEHFICKDLIAYIKLSIDNTDKESFLRIINKPFRYISKLNLEKLKRNNIKQDVFSYICSLDDISVTQIKVIKQLKKQINNIRKYNIVESIRYINLELSYHSYVVKYCTENKNQVENMNSIKDSFVRIGINFQTKEEFLVHINNVNQQLNNNKVKKTGVTLSTIHGVKGMEFKNIFIINCNFDNIPYSKDSYINIEEERRLFYVAITRTMENLWIYYNNSFNGVKKEPSPFLKECGLL